MSQPDHVDRTVCSLLLFLATPAEEAGLVKAAQDRRLEFEKIKDRHLGGLLRFGQIGTETVIASLPRRESGRIVMGSHGRLGTAARGIDLRNATGARGIIQLGMAFGADSTRQRLGDVLVSTSLIPYDNRVVRDSRLSTYIVDYTEAGPEPAHPALVSRFRGEAEREHPYGVHLGPILSGAARIHSALFRDELVRSVATGEGPVIGGEMEGVGLLAASVEADNPIWCVVKGISDFADEHRDAVIDSSRPIACRNAADFVLSALQNGRVG